MKNKNNILIITTFCSVFFLIFTILFHNKFENSSHIETCKSICGHNSFVNAVKITEPNNSFLCYCESTPGIYWIGKVKNE